MHRTLLTATTALCGLATAVVADTDRGAVLTTYADIAAAASAAAAPVMPVIET